MARRDELNEALVDAVDVLRTLAKPMFDVFDLDGVTDSERTPAVAHALGVIEGAAIALGVTPIELLDEYGLLE